MTCCPAPILAISSGVHCDDAAWFAGPAILLCVLVSILSIPTYRVNEESPDSARARPRLCLCLRPEAGPRSGHRPPHRQCSSLNPRKWGSRWPMESNAKAWTPWTLGHSSHRGMAGHPRHRTASGPHSDHRPASGHTAANLASSSACSTARFRRRRHRKGLKIRTVHRPAGKACQPPDQAAAVAPRK